MILEIIYFIYGLSFFMLGLLGLLYMRGDSRLLLSKRLWLIGLFGILHGINEWIDMISLSSESNSLKGLQCLIISDLVLLPLSFFFLLEFGVRLFIDSKKKYSALKMLPLTLFAVFVTIIGLSGNRFLIADVMARYLLALPATALTSYALLLQTPEIKDLRAAFNFKSAALILFLYGIFSGLIVPDAGFFPARVLNYSFIVDTFGIPVQVFRTLCAVGLAYNLTRIVRIFMRETEQAILRERDRAQNYLDIAGTIIVALNTEGEVTLINKKGCEVLGYGEDEIIGKNWFGHFLPERIRDSVKKTFDLLVVGTVQPVEYFENPVLSRNGEERFIAWHNTLLRNQENQITGTLSSGENITERKKLEKALLEIEDRERQHIGYELHDSLGQLLTGISFKNRSLQKELKKRLVPEAEEAADIGALINEAKIQAKMLAQGLSPIGTEGSGLMSALESLATNTQGLFKIQCTFTCNEPVLLRNEKVTFQLYRIAQEAVSNAVRHSQCNNITLFLRREENSVILKIRDNGIGISGISPDSNGMGLKIMRYRASMIGATFSTEVEEGNGTVVTCDFTDDIHE